MDEYTQQTYGDFDSEYREPQKNVLGVVGFALSFCTGPVGLIISLIALKDRPRGFAIAGVIISILSTIALAIGGWFMFWAVGLGMKAVEAGQDYEAVSAAVGRYQSANADTLPPDIAALALTAEQSTDPWGKPYRFVPAADGTGWTLVSAGMDGVFDSTDDIQLKSGMSSEDVQDEIGERIGKHYEEKFGRPTP